MIEEFNSAIYSDNNEKLVSVFVNTSNHGAVRLKVVKEETLTPKQVRELCEDLSCALKEIEKHDNRFPF